MNTSHTSIPVPSPLVYSQVVDCKTTAEDILVALFEMGFEMHRSGDWSQLVGSTLPPSVFVVIPVGQLYASSPFP
jgi:hypothetical protein